MRPLPLLAAAALLAACPAGRAGAQGATQRIALTHTVSSTTFAAATTFPVDEKTGLNEPIYVEGVQQGLAWLEWIVLDRRGADAVVPWRGPVELDRPTVRFAIPAGCLAPGAYKVQARAWASAGRGAGEVASGPLEFTVAGRGIALLVGIDAYQDRAAYPRLRHAVDDARAMREALIRWGYTPENVVLVLGATDRNGSPIVATDGPPRAGYATRQVLDEAFQRLVRLVYDRHAVHVLIFCAGHGGVLALDAGIRLDCLVAADGTRLPTDRWATTLVRLLGARVGGGPDAAPTVVGLYDIGRSATGESPGATVAVAPVGAARYVRIDGSQMGWGSNENLSDDARFGVEYEGAHFPHGFFTFSLLKTLERLQPTGRLTVGGALDGAAAVLSELMARSSRVDGGSRVYVDQRLTAKEDVPASVVDRPFLYTR